MCCVDRGQITVSFTVLPPGRTRCCRLLQHLTLAASEKHRQINLFFTVAGTVSTARNASATERPAPVPRCPAPPLQAAQQARLGRWAIRVAADTRTAAPAACRAARPRRPWPNTRAGHAAGNPPRRDDALRSAPASSSCSSALLARFFWRVAWPSGESCGGPSVDVDVCRAHASASAAAAVCGRRRAAPLTSSMASLRRRR